MSDEINGQIPEEKPRDDREPHCRAGSRGVAGGNEIVIIRAKNSSTDHVPALSPQALHI